MKAYILASGSKGNCTLITSKGHNMIIDLGLNHKNLVTKLEEIGYTLDDVEALIFTHDHADHVGGIDKNIDLHKCYTAKGNIKELPIENELEHYKQYVIAGFKVTVLPTSHDATNPIGFIIEDDKDKMLYMTDTGYISDKNFAYMTNCDHYIIESNHDYKMLMQTNRPESLKLRIISDYGHLNNDDSAEVISHLIGDKTKNIVLAHLSEEANSPEVALSTYRRIFMKNKVSLDNINLCCANQHSTVVIGSDSNED